MYEIKLQIPFNGFHVAGTMVLPVKARSLIIFAHGTGIASASSEEKTIASSLQYHGFGTLMFNLLDSNGKLSRNYKDIDLLTDGLITATNWLKGHSQYQELHLAYIGSGTGASVAFKAASKVSSHLKTIISLDGRVDLVRKELSTVRCPVLLLAKEHDYRMVNINRYAIRYLKGQKRLAIIPAASPNLLDKAGEQEATNIISTWLKKHLFGMREKVTI